MNFQMKFNTYKSNDIDIGKKNRNIAYNKGNKWLDIK